VATMTERTLDNRNNHVVSDGELEGERQIGTSGRDFRNLACVRHRCARIDRRGQATSILFRLPAMRRRPSPDQDRHNSSWNVLMRVHVVYAHPLQDSLAAQLHQIVVEELTKAGHDVDDLDLYAEGFDPVLSAHDRETYHD